MKDSRATKIALDAYGVAIEGETDPRRCGERAHRLDALLERLTEEELEEAYLAAHRLAEAQRSLGSVTSVVDVHTGGAA